MKIEINLNASSLPYTTCIKRWYMTVVDGYKVPLLNSAMVYGLAIHKYIDMMFKTRGHVPTAREAMLKQFRIPKIDSKKQMHLCDERHLNVTAFNLWEFYIQQDGTFDLIELNQKCWKCKGVGVCDVCNSTGMIVAPATEVDFSFRYYEDDYVIVNLCGTLDLIGKVRNGCYAVGDWKTTSDYKPDDYLDRYRQSYQLRFYLLALKIMARLHPESTLGQIGLQNPGAFINGIFLKPSPSDNLYKRSHVFQFGKELDVFEKLLVAKIKTFSFAVQHGYHYEPEGLSNGSCFGLKYPCPFAHAVCGANEGLAKLLLDRDFKKELYNPLAFHDDV